MAPLRLVLTNATEAYEQLTSSVPGLRVLLDEQAQSVSLEHAEQVLAVWDCYRQHGTTTAFTFHSSNARATRFEEVDAALLLELHRDPQPQPQPHPHPQPQPQPQPHPQPQPQPQPHPSPNPEPEP